MKNFLLFIGLLALGGCKRSDNKLRERLDGFLHSYETLDLEKMITYYHPSIFKLTSREDLLKDMNAQIADRWDRIRIDSIIVDSLYPAFEVDGARYSKITYSVFVKANIPPADQNPRPDSITPGGIDHHIGDAYPAPQATLMRTLILGDGPGIKELGIDVATGWTKFRLPHQLVAIKNKDSKDWGFISFDEEPGESKLLDKDVINRLKTYK